MNAFQLQAMGPATGKAVGTGNVIDDVTFTDIRIAAASAVRKCGAGNGCNCVPPCAYDSPMPHGLPNIIQGWPGNKISNVRFVDVKIAGLPVKGMLDGTYPGYFNISDSSTVSNIYAGATPSSEVEFLKKK